MASPPSTFISYVRFLPVNLDRMDSWPVVDLRTGRSSIRYAIEWRPDRHSDLIGRIRTYRVMLATRREARNVREAVAMLAALVKLLREAAAYQGGDR